MELSKERKNEILGIFISVFAILLGISLYSNSAGIIGKILQVIFAGLAGKGAYIFPVLFLAWGIALIWSRTLKITPRLVGLIIVVCSMLVFLHLIMIPFGEEFPAALEGKGGGLFGSIFAFLLRKFIGQTGAYVVLSAVMLIGFLLFFDVLLVALFLAFKQKCCLFWQKVVNLFAGIKDKVKKLLVLVLKRKQKRV